MILIISAPDLLPRFSRSLSRLGLSFVKSWSIRPKIHLCSQIYQPPQHLKPFVMARITKPNTLNKAAWSDFLNSSSLSRRRVQPSKAIPCNGKIRPRLIDKNQPIISVDCNTILLYTLNLWSWIALDKVANTHSLYKTAFGRRCSRTEFF